MGPWDHPRIQLVQLIDCGFALALLEDKQSLVREDCNVPKSDMHANPKNDMHANPKSGMHANPKSEMLANLKSDMHANPKSDLQTLKVTCMTSKHYLMMHAPN